MGFLNCTKTMVMLSHPSPPAVDGAKHLSSTLSQTTESLFSCMTYSIQRQTGYYNCKAYIVPLDQLAIYILHSLISC